MSSLNFVDAVMAQIKKEDQEREATRAAARRRRQARTARNHALREEARVLAERYHRAQPEADQEGSIQEMADSVPW